MQIAYGAQARAKVLSGADRLADAVRVTLGPKGRNGAVHQKKNTQGASFADRAEPGAPVLITNDRATIAESIVLPDPMEDLGVQLLRQVSNKAKEAAGDGTSTAIVLAQAMLHETFRCAASGADSLALRRGMEKAGKAAGKALEEMSISVTDEKALARAAAVSCGDPELGALIGRACAAVGPEGVVQVEDGQKQDTTLELQQGIVLERGFLAPEMATNPDKTSAELDDPYILLCDSKLDDIQVLLPALIACAEDGHDCLILCEELSGNARSTILRTNLQGDITIVCIEAPLYGEGRRWRMEDLSIQLGATYFQQGLHMDLRDIRPEQFGRAGHVTITRQRTVISEPGGDPEKMQQRIAQLRYLASHEEYEFNRKRHAERLAQLVSGVAVIRVGGKTQTELWERKMRLEGGVHAARAAQAEGIVPGGGTAFLRLIPKVNESMAALSDEEQMGVRAVTRALEAPVRQIAENAGQDGSYMVQKLMGMAPEMGYDAAEDCVCPMVDSGIIDPVWVVRTSLESALSVAATILTVQASVVGGVERV